MTWLADELRSEIDLSHARLRALTERDVTEPRVAAKWSRKEILGHLIDSAANNHQRFVRAQFVDSLAWPGYQQADWVSVQRYRDEPWSDLLDLWAAFNRHLAHVIEYVPESKTGTQCVIGNGEPVTLEWLMRDYLRHLRHHLAQILDSGT
jgi:DinB superfamily